MFHTYTSSLRHVCCVSLLTSLFVQFSYLYRIPLHLRHFYLWINQLSGFFTWITSLLHLCCLSLFTSLFVHLSYMYRIPLHPCHLDLWIHPSPGWFSHLSHIRTPPVLRRLLPLLYQPPDCIICALFLPVPHPTLPVSLWPLSPSPELFPHLHRIPLHLCRFVLWIHHLDGFFTWILTFLLHLCCVSVDRYVAITDPFNYDRKMTPRFVAWLLAGVWTVSALVSHLPINPRPQYRWSTGNLIIISCYIYAMKSQQGRVSISYMYHRYYKGIRSSRCTLQAITVIYRWEFTNRGHYMWSSCMIYGWPNHHKLLHTRKEVSTRTILHYIYCMY